MVKKSNRIEKTVDITFEVTATVTVPKNAIDINELASKFALSRLNVIESPNENTESDAFDEYLSLCEEKGITEVACDRMWRKTKIELIDFSAEVKKVS